MVSEDFPKARRQVEMRIGVRDKGKGFRGSGFRVSIRLHKTSKGLQIQETEIVEVCDAAASVVVLDLVQISA